MATYLADHVWSIGELLDVALGVVPIPEPTIRAEPPRWIGRQEPKGPAYDTSEPQRDWRRAPPVTQRPKI